ncbi:peptidylprolyl isomerase [Aestuariibacter halophilus]|uniref:peptidylprolyl isomerase n=1 Tax=Fluctibacter halophilus TaxID=226011 RepID=A0ABS8G4K7_9ALTE|nr:peptidylprolyl isomerase [Aestuariibacter halophilus]MCC2615071.1 peptidylprolyl isomerase [Aestuariibacter halophilus]
MSLVNTPEISVNGTVIPPSAIDAEIQYHPASSRREAMILAAQTLIIEQVLKQRAEKLGIFTLIPSGGISNDDLIDKLFELEVAVPQATVEECLRYYKANQETFKTAPLVEAKHILLAADPEDIVQRAEARQLALALIEQLCEDALQFSRLARMYSACPSKEVDGSLGQVSHGQTVPEFQRQLFAAPEGLMQKPIESRFGFHIVWIARKVDGVSLPFDTVEQKIANYLNEKVRTKAIAQYLQQLLADADIDGFDFGIEKSPLVQ